MVVGEGNAVLAVVASERVFGCTCSVEASVKEAGVKGHVCKSGVPSSAGDQLPNPQLPNIPSDGLPVSQYRDLNSASHKSACAAKPESAQDGSSVCRKKGAVASTQSTRELALPACPNGCKSGKIYRDGLRYNQDGSQTQRWLCTCCGQRFSEKPLKIECDIEGVAKYALGAKNLHVPTRKHAGAGVLTAETKALITVYEGWLRKEGYKESRYPNDLKTLVYLGADLMDPEDVKAKIGTHKVKDGTKMLLTYAYDAFVKMNKMSWERPYYKQEEIIPFVPEESEIDQLIAAAQSHRMATFLQTLKETFADPGEGLAIERKDIAGIVININHPVKDHRPRGLKVSDKLIAMINMLPHTSERIFDAKYSNMCDAFLRLRKRVAAKTKNDRFLYIEFRSIRHWGGTMIAELTNGNVLTVMQLLGHRNVENSMKYINIYKLRFRKDTEFDVVTATTPDEIKTAIASGFEFVCEKAGMMFFRRVKRISLAGTPINKREPDLVNL